MARQKGTFTLSSNIENNAAAPLDARMLVKSMTELTDANSFPYFYKGMIVSVQNENKVYHLIGNDPTVISNWEELGAGAQDAQLPIGGTAGQALVKKSSADQDVEWKTVTPGHSIQNGAGTSFVQEPVVQFTGLKVVDDEESEKTVISGIGLSADSINDIVKVGLPTPVLMGNGLNYSTEEQVIGRWIDGKPVYQKTYDFTVPVSAESDIIIGDLPKNCDKVIDIRGARYYGEGYGTPSYYLDASSYAIPYTAKGKLRLLQADQERNSFYLTIQYTKLEN